MEEVKKRKDKQIICLQPAYAQKLRNLVREDDGPCINSEELIRDKDCKRLVLASLRVGAVQLYMALTLLVLQRDRSSTLHDGLDHVCAPYWL
jgi:hypothetical protein